MKSELLKRFISSIILLPIIFFIIIKGSILFYFLLLLAFTISVYEWHQMSKNKSYYLYGFIFLIISFLCIYKLRINPDNDFLKLIIVTIICILTDIGGYIFGKFFKGPKLTKYSPNKTYSGVIGGYLLSLSLIIFFINFEIFNGEYLLRFTLFVFLVSTVSQFGDICVSYFKRISKIKDTGNIIPGHGGLLDRIDGMIFAYPFSYLITLTTYFSNI